MTLHPPPVSRTLKAPTHTPAPQPEEMKILQTQPSQLTNTEALAHLHKIHTEYTQREADPSPHLRAGYKSDTGAQLRNLHSVVTDAIHHLTHNTGLAVSTAPRDAARADEDVERVPVLIRRLDEEFREVGLAKKERLMICNLRPRDALTLELCIEDVDERMSAAGKEKMVGMIKEVFQGRPGPVNGHTNGQRDGQMNGHR
ncbi:MAG: hypothetical protein M1828_005216 [Chrysothrix sp. TS-e1954]|nr:MAG: hypothetical protein M1828_005216 [Chrysothrix sp. TS-e1954]